MTDDGSNPYLLHRLDDIRESIIRIDQKVDLKLGDHSERIARLEVRADNTDEYTGRLAQSIDRLATALEHTGMRDVERRRWIVTTVAAVLLGVGSVIATIFVH